MGKILYDEKTILEAKSNIERCNTAIIDAISKIYVDLLTMNDVLNTPNANKGITLYQDYVDKKIKYTKSMKENYNNAFNIISSEYHDYSSKVSKTVGGTND